MSVTVLPVTTKRERKLFINFNYQLYKESPYAVPELYSDVDQTLHLQKNPSLRGCRLQLFLAWKDGEVVGRVAAILQKHANQRWNTRNVRFGWIDFINDVHVAEALLTAVAQWGRQHGMTHIQGPMGITDIDPEGMLIQGFDCLGTMSSIYNYDYYPQLLEQLGFCKETDWVEMKMDIPAQVPDKYARVSQLCMQRYGLQVLTLKSGKELITKGYGKQMFQIINESYAPLFGYSQLNSEAIDAYVKKFSQFLDPRMVCGVLDTEGHLIAVGASMPSIARALQKAQGHLWPTGWYHLLRSLKFRHEEGVELLLIGILPQWQQKGVTGIIFNHLIQVYQQMHFKWAETNWMLEDNAKVLTQWQYLNPQIIKRRRCYIKKI